MLGHIVLVCGHFSCQRNISNTRFVKVCVLDPFSASDPQSGYRWFGCSEILTLLFYSPRRRPCAGDSQQEYKILQFIVTAWRLMPFFLSFENWIPWVINESAVRPMGLSSSAWIFLSSHTQGIKEALDHLLPLLEADSSKQESSTKPWKSLKQGGFIGKAWLFHVNHLCSY